MTPREGFKYGFLLRCAEEGLTAEEAEVRASQGLEKHAEDPGFFNQIAGDVYGFGKSMLSGVPKVISDWGPTIVGAGGLAAAGAGGLTGYGLAKAQEGDTSPEEIQQEELISAYRTQAELARRKAIMDAAQASRPRPKSFHGI